MRRDRLLGSALLAAGLAGAALLSRPAPSTVVRVSDDRVLTVQAATTAPAGSALVVKVSGAIPRRAVTLQATGSLGTTTMALRATRAGAARFTLDRDATRVAGRMTLLATVPDGQGSAEVELTPGPAVGPVVTVVGARSIVADGADLAMAVAIPQDRLGNAVSTGTPVDIVRVHPDGTVSSETVLAAHLLAWADLPSGTLAGAGQVRGGVGVASGPLARLDEVPAPPVAFDLTSQRPLPPADGQSLVAVRTTRLRDAHGNVEADGTLVTFEWDGPSGRARTAATTVDGIARTYLQAPALPGDVTVHALSRGTRSRSLDLAFVPLTGTVPVRATRVTAGLRVVVGPVLGPAGGYVADGSAVTVTVTDSRGVVERRVAGTIDGRLDLRVPLAGLRMPVTAEAEVLGLQGTAELP